MSKKPEKQAEPEVAAELRQSVAAGVRRKGRKNCIGCKYLSGLSQMGERYCRHPERKDKQGKTGDVRLRQWFCPI